MFPAHWITASLSLHSGCILILTYLFKSQWNIVFTLHTLHERDERKRILRVIASYAFVSLADSEPELFHIAFIWISIRTILCIYLILMIYNIILIIMQLSLDNKNSDFQSKPSTYRLNTILRIELPKWDVVGGIFLIHGHVIQLTRII